MPTPNQPTPPAVAEALNVLAAYLRAEGFAEVMVSPQGGAAFTLDTAWGRLSRLSVAHAAESQALRGLVDELRGLAALALREHLEGRASYTGLLGALRRIRRAAKRKGGA